MFFFLIHRGTEVLAPHGIPTDLLDRVLIIHTDPYTTEEIAAIITLRAKTEGISVSQDSMGILAQVGERTSLRYAVQLLTPANILAKTYGHEEITVGDVEQVTQLFLDGKASAAILREHERKFLH